MGSKCSVEEGNRAESDCTEINTSLDKKIDRDGVVGHFIHFLLLSKVCDLWRKEWLLIRGEE